jgi:hypothetical protein
MMVFQGDFFAITRFWFRQVEMLAREWSDNLDIWLFSFRKVLLWYMAQNNRIQASQSVYTQAEVATAIQLFQIRSACQPTSAVFRVEFLGQAGEKKKPKGHCQSATDD